MAGTSPLGALQIKDTGPGQNASATRAESTDNALHASTCARDAATNGTAADAGRFFKANRRATAAGDAGSTANPYSVSVGKATTPPDRRNDTASAKSSGRQDRGSTRSVCTSHPSSYDPGQQRQRGRISQKHRPHTRRPDESGNH